MITLAFSQVLWSLAVSWTDVTGGDNGLPGVMRPHIGLWSLGSTVGYFYFVLAIFVVVAVMLYIFVSSPLGYRCAASATMRCACARSAIMSGLTNISHRSSPRRSPASRASFTCSSTASSPPRRSASPSQRRCSLPSCSRRRHAVRPGLGRRRLRPAICAQHLYRPLALRDRRDLCAAALRPQGALIYLRDWSKARRRSMGFKPLEIRIFRAISACNALSP